MHVREKRINKFIALFFALLILFSAVCSATINYTGYADDNPYPFDQTNVLEDLESSKDFNLLEWVWDYSGIFKTPMVMNFVEWCYSPFVKGDFALYIYFYNPSNLNIDVDNYSNRVQMASAYSGSGIITRESTPTDYDTYNIIYCNKSVRQNYEGMFYKFRVVDKKGADGLTLAERVYSGERRYDISGLVLATEDGAVREIGVGGTYYFSGYAAGYGPDANADNTLKCTGFQPLETISLEVHSTNYRTGMSAAGIYHYNDVASVYFSVPNRYFDDYGALQKIKAEWYEYKTDYMFITHDVATYEAFKPYEGVSVGDYSENVDVSFTSGYTNNGHWFDKTYNKDISNGVFDGEVEQIEQLDWVMFETTGIIDRAEMEKHIYTYKGTSGKTLEVADGTISADLFSDTVDEGRTRGYNVCEIDANDTFDLLSYEKAGNGWWDMFLEFGIYVPGNLGENHDDVLPIQYDLNDFMGLTDPSLSKQLLINEGDIDDFRKFFQTAEEQDEKTVLFRFAVTDYYEEGLWSLHPGISGGVKGQYAVLAQETVFLDFKIIHLTFQKDGAYTVIPVTQDPINIIYAAGTEWENKTSMDNFTKTLASWGLTLVFVVVVILVIYLIIKIIPVLIKLARGKVVVSILLIALLIAVALVGLAFLGDWLYGFIANMGSLL